MTFTTTIKWCEEIPNLIELGKQGKTYQEIGDTYGVSRERIRQVLRKFLPNWDVDFGATRRRMFRAQEEAEHRWNKWGDKEDSALYKSRRRKFLAKKNNAVREGHSWNLNFGDLEWPSHCPVLGVELDYFNEYRAENSPSFDQKEPGKGYVQGNVTIMSWRANRIKNDGTAEEHRRIADWLER